MKRYAGDGLPPNSNVAVVANDAVGNFVVATPLLQLIRKCLAPAQLDYYGGVRTKELQETSSLISWSHPSHGHSSEVVRQAHDQRRSEIGDYDLVINLERGEFAQRVARDISHEQTWVSGPCLNGNQMPLAFGTTEQDQLWEDPDWTATDLTERYGILDSGFIGEIFARLNFLKGPVPTYQVPTEDPDSDLPEVIVSGAASLPEKLWPAEKWDVVLSRLKESGATVGLVGAKPQAQRDFWRGADLEDEWVSKGYVQDLRGMYTLPQVSGLLSRVCKVLTIDNGILHLAAAADTPTVGLFRNGIHRLWAPPVSGLRVLTPEPGLDVASIEVDQVWEALESV